MAQPIASSLTTRGKVPPPNTGLDLPRWAEGVAGRSPCSSRPAVGMLHAQVKPKPLGGGRASAGD